MRRLGGQISWSIFGFIAGMFIVVQAVEGTGLTVQFGQLLLHLSGGSSFGAVMVGTAGAAIGTNIINNVPMAVVLLALCYWYANRGVLQLDRNSCKYPRL